MIELLSSDNIVTISRISALLDGAGVEFIVLGAHASLLGGGIHGLGQRVMVVEQDKQKARHLIREEGLENDVDFPK